MNNVLAGLGLTALIAVPAVAVISVYRDELVERLRPVSGLLAFDPRHPALSYSPVQPRPARES